MKTRRKTSPINGLVGHLTQPLNHDCATNKAWVLARTALRPRWMVTPSATPAGGYWRTVRLWSIEYICKKTGIATSLLTE
ncbi:MAG TPA: hypothetical protein D7H90_00040 [Candidatus Poseidoniales archaeon]|nr:MAG TPA: hypothetical protein D7H90_00040 [Candidatus Poseidoniales archaeon]